MKPETEPTPRNTCPNDAPSPPTGTATSHLFENFPLELQMMVWECVPTNRRCFVVDTIGLIATPVPGLSPKHQVILAVCKLSRKISLQRFVLAYAAKRSPVFWELSLQQPPLNSQVAPHIYIDPVYDIFDITSLTRGMYSPTLEFKKETALSVKNSITRILGPELPLELIRNVAVGTPEYCADTLYFVDEPVRNFNHKHHGERYKTAIESVILPKVKTIILVPAYDIYRLYRGSNPFITPRRYFEKKLMTAAQINEGLVFEGRMVEADFVTSNMLGAETTVVQKVGEGTCYMESILP